MLWDKSENSLRQALESKELDFWFNLVKVHFMGRKLSFHSKIVWDEYGNVAPSSWIFLCLKDWELVMLMRVQIKKVPVMIHRAMLGSLERFIGILIEHLLSPSFWLSPNQVVVCSVTQKNNEYASLIAKNLMDASIRVTTDLRNEKIGFKIREHTLQRAYILVIGAKEEQDGLIRIRQRIKGDIGEENLQNFIISLVEKYREEGKYIVLRRNIVIETKKNKVNGK